MQSTGVITVVLDIGGRVSPVSTFRALRMVGAGSSEGDKLHRCSLLGGTATGGSAGVCSNPSGDIR